MNCIVWFYSRNKRRVTQVQRLGRDFGLQYKPFLLFGVLRKTHAIELSRFLANTLDGTRDAFVMFRVPSDCVFRAHQASAITFPPLSDRARYEIIE